MTPMTRKHYISRQNLQPRPPVAFTLALCLLLDRVVAPPWLWILTLVSMGVWWFVVLLAIGQSKEIDLFATTKATEAEWPTEIQK